MSDTQVITGKIARNAQSANPKKNPAMRRRFHQRSTPATIRVKELPGPYLHPIPQRFAGLVMPRPIKTGGAFGGCTKGKRNLRKQHRAAA